MKGGIYFHVQGNTPFGDVAFDCYHLDQEVYEQAAREAGLTKELSWEVTSVPDRYLEGEGLGGASMEELQTYLHSAQLWITGCWQVAYHEAIMPTKKIYLLPNSRFQVAPMIHWHIGIYVLPHRQIQRPLFWPVEARG